MKKLKLSELKIQSFVTSLNAAHKQTVQGGASAGGAAGCNTNIGTGCTFACNSGNCSGGYGCGGGGGGGNTGPANTSACPTSPSNQCNGNGVTNPTTKCGAYC